MLARISSQELSEWIAYADLEPFGPLQEELRAGTITATVANTARDPKRKRKGYQPADFFYSLKKAAKEGRRYRQQPWEGQLAIVRILNAAFGGREVRKESN